MIVSVINNKGGVGKTTTTLSLATALMRRGKKVLIIDLDSQMNLTSCAGMKVTDNVPKISTYLNDERRVDKTGITPEGLYILAADEELINVEFGLAEMDDMKEATRVLKKCIMPISRAFDFVFIDCSPNRGTLFMNAMTASDLLIIPVSNDMAREVLRNIRTAKQGFGIRTEERILITMFDARRNTDKELADSLRADFPGRVFENVIPYNAVFDKAAKHHHSIFEEDESGRGTKAYEALADEFLADFSDIGTNTD